MKLSVLQENLDKALSIAVRVVAVRPQLPVLTHVLLKTDKGRLKTSATDLETGINFWVGAKIEKKGEITVPAKILSEFVSSLPPGRIDIEAKENLLKLESGNFKAKFNGLAASEFPKMPKIDGKSILEMENKVFNQAVSQVAFSAALDETRPALSGIYFFLDGSILNLVATDGYRLSVKSIKKVSSKDKKLKGGLIVPAQAFKEAARVSDKDKINFYLADESNQLIFQVGDDAEIITRLIEGQFPDYEKIIPEDGKIKTVVETEEFTRVVKIASIFARESANIVCFDLSKEGIKVSANTAQVGENQSVVDAQVKGGEDKIAFNSRYLLDFLSVVGSENFVFKMEKSLKPGIFTPEKDESFLHVIMPVRVEE